MKGRENTSTSARLGGEQSLLDLLLAESVSDLVALAQSSNERINILLLNEMNLVKSPSKSIVIQHNHPSRHQ